MATAPLFLTQSLTRTFRSLKSYNYRLWASGAIVSNIGTWVQRTAQDWLVLTQLTHHSASAVGTVMALQFAPQFLFLPITGAAADRFEQRRLLMVTQVTMALLALALGVLTVTGLVQLWHVDVFAFLFGTAAAFDAPARQTFVAELVDDADLGNAVALNSTSFNVGRMAGPGVAGLLIASVGTGWSFVLNGLSYFAVLASLLVMRRGELKAKPRVRKVRGSFAAGLRYVRQRGDLIATLLMLFFMGTFGLNFALYISTMAVSVFHTSAHGFALLSSAMALGTVTGALLNAARERPRFEQLVLSSGLFGLFCGAGALAPGYWTFAACLVAIGVVALMFMNASNTLMQLATEPSMRGRVMALRIAVAAGGTPIGAPIVGFLADHLGPRWGMGLGALGGIAAAAVGLGAIALGRKARARET